MSPKQLLWIYIAVLICWYALIIGFFRVYSERMAYQSSYTACMDYENYVAQNVLTKKQKWKTASYLKKKEEKRGGYESK
jgi:hypothetical protein